MDYKSLKDQKLMELYQENDVIAFEEIYSRYSPICYGYTLKKIKDEATAQDILQQLFLKIHDHRFDYKTHLSFSSWIFSILKNSINDHFRKKKEVLIEDYPEIPSTDSTENSKIDDHLSDLSEQQKEVIKKRFVDDKDYESIASDMNLSTSHARQIFSRALKILRKKGNIQ